VGAELVDKVPEVAGPSVIFLGVAKRTSELVQECIEFPPVIYLFGELSMLARQDVLYNGQEGFLECKEKSYLVKILKLILTILTIPRLRVPFLEFPLLDRPSLTSIFGLTSILLMFGRILLD
jgi:hypothetical protein